MHETPPTPALNGSLPTVMPVLARGRHRSPRSGACFMEMASFLAGESWSDHPACTHPLLARLARDVNDRTSHRARARLGLLVPSVVGLQDDDPATDARLALLCARRALPVSSQDRQNVLAVSLLTGEESLARLEGRPHGDLSPETRAALEQVPHAAAWARRFTDKARADSAARGLARRRAARAARAEEAAVRDYRHRGAPFAVTASVAGIAAAWGIDCDAEMHDLLADAVALVSGRAAAAGTSGASVPPALDPWAGERWEEACRLTATRRR